MDEGRKADLERLDKRLHTRRVTSKTEIIQTDTFQGEPVMEAVRTESYNARADRAAKEQAGAAMHKILAESKNKKLRSLREKLIKAAKAGDAKEERRLTNLIRIAQKQPAEEQL